MSYRGPILEWSALIINELITITFALVFVDNMQAMAAGTEYNVTYKYTRSINHIVTCM